MVESSLLMLRVVDCLGGNCRNSYYVFCVFLGIGKANGDKYLQKAVA